MKIYTITLNPAYDLHATAGSLALQCENHLTLQKRDVGGKGINISRALKRNGTPNTAITVLGADNSSELKSCLTNEGIEHMYIELSGRIRENLTIHVPNSDETRISFDGPRLDASILGSIYDIIETSGIDSNTIITLTGSVPDGIPMPKLLSLLSRFRTGGAKIVIDSRSFALDDLIYARPWLIKPNRDELSAYAGAELKSFNDCLDIAKRLRNSGIENVMASLGGLGAMLVTKETVITAIPPSVRVCSTIGAGDSSIAGFIAAYASGKNSEEQLRTAVAYGTAACLLEGTAPPEPYDIAEIYEKTQVSVLSV